MKNKEQEGRKRRKEGREGGKGRKERKMKRRKKKGSTHFLIEKEERAEQGKEHSGRELCPTVFKHDS